MKDCFYQYRKGLYEALNGNVSYDGDDVTVMEFAGHDQVTPYIELLGMSATPETDYTTESQIVITDIRIVTSHQGEIDDFGSKQSDAIMNDVMELLITQGVTVADRAKHITMDDFIDNGCWFESLTYDNTYDGNILRIEKILTIRTMIDED